MIDWSLNFCSFVTFWIHLNACSHRLLFAVDWGSSRVPCLMLTSDSVCRSAHLLPLLASWLSTFLLVVGEHVQRLHLFEGYFWEVWLQWMCCQGMRRGLWDVSANLDKVPWTWPPYKFITPLIDDPNSSICSPKVLTSSSVPFECWENAASLSQTCQESSWIVTTCAYAQVCGCLWCFIISVLLILPCIFIMLWLLMYFLLCHIHLWRPCFRHVYSAFLCRWKLLANSRWDQLSRDSCIFCNF